MVFLKKSKILIYSKKIITKTFKKQLNRKKIMQTRLNFIHLILLQLYNSNAKYILPRVITYFLQCVQQMSCELRIQVSTGICTIHDSRYDVLYPDDLSCCQLYVNSSGSIWVVVAVDGLNRIFPILVLKLDEFI